MRTDALVAASDIAGKNLWIGIVAWIPQFEEVRAKLGRRQTTAVGYFFTGIAPGVPHFANFPSLRQRTDDVAIAGHFVKRPFASLQDADSAGAEIPPKAAAKATMKATLRFIAGLQQQADKYLYSAASLAKLADELCQHQAPGSVCGGSRINPQKVSAWVGRNLPLGSEVTDDPPPPTSFTVPQRPDVLSTGK